MSKLDQRFHEDKALRDAARKVLMADIEHAKTSLSGKHLAGRVVGRVGEGAQDVFEVAKTQADDKRGILAALVGAILLWISREPIMEILGLSEPDEDPAPADSVEPDLADTDADTGSELDASGPSTEDPTETEIEEEDIPPPTPPGETDDRD